jgi:hypothetical protein
LSDGATLKKIVDALEAFGARLVVNEGQPDLFVDEEDTTRVGHCELFIYGPPITPGLKREVQTHKSALIKAFRWDEEKARERIRQAVAYTAKRVRKGTICWQPGVLDEAEEEINRAHEARDMWRYRKAVTAWVRAWPEAPEDPKNEEAA